MIEIGGDLLMAIIRLLESVNEANQRPNAIIMSPGEEVKKAFGIDFTKNGNYKDY